MTAALRVALLSLEPWDEVWRRNQHLATRLVAMGSVSSLLFVEPPVGGWALRARRRGPLNGIEVVTPPLVLPRRYGGRAPLAVWLRRLLVGVDLLWVNDAVASRRVLGLGMPAIHDVTDDWREMPQPSSERARVIAAEDVLARRVPTVVCSSVLAERWRIRYGVECTVVRNGVDVGAMKCADRRALTGAQPHVVYVGTLHDNRVDFDLIEQLAAHPSCGTLHLVGPYRIGRERKARLRELGVLLHGPVPATEVPSWLVSADVLVCPHLVDSFTLSLDAIKAHEYLATDRPIVATPSCGFQSLEAPGLTVTDRSTFVSAVFASAGTGPFTRPTNGDWDERALEFATVLRGAIAAAG